VVEVAKVAELHPELAERLPIAMLGEAPRANRLEFERAALRVRRVVVVVTDPVVVGSDRLVLVRRPNAVELLVFVDDVEVVQIDEHGARPKAVDAPGVALPHRFGAVERAAGVRPIERRN